MDSIPQLFGTGCPITVFSRFVYRLRRVGWDDKRLFFSSRVIGMKIPFCTFHCSEWTVRREVLGDVLACGPFGRERE